jgi:hypothetical protein
VFGYQTFEGKKKWFDGDCEKVLTDSNEARMKMLQRETRNTAENFHRKRREAKYLLRRKKRVGKEPNTTRGNV